VALIDEDALRLALAPLRIQPWQKQSSRKHANTAGREIRFEDNSGAALVLATYWACAKCCRA